MTYVSPLLNSINIPQIRFRSLQSGFPQAPTIMPDSFTTNPLYDIGDKASVERLAKSSPRVMEILKENKIPLKVNIEELEKLQKGHLADTRVTAAKIYSSLPAELKSEINLPDLQSAAMLHDYGKVLIPDKILNKNGKLDDKEKRVMELHSELGAELLRQKGVNENVLNLVKYHHQTLQGDGYPAITDNYTPDLSSQILMAADKYSALREARSYKSPLTHSEALQIIHEDVDKGLIGEDVYRALDGIGK